MSLMFLLCPCIEIITLNYAVLKQKYISISDCPKEWYEIYFVFACVWAFGAAMFQDQV